MQIFRLLLSLKFTKFVMSFLKPIASFSSNFASLSIVMRNNSYALFHEKLYILSTKWTNQVHIFRLSTACMKIKKIPCHFSSDESVFTLILCHISVPWHIIPLKFSSWNIKLWTKSPSKVQIFRFLSALMKVHPVPQASFETTRSSFIQI